MARRQVGCKNASAVTRYRGDAMSGTTDALFLTQLGICIRTSETQYQVCTMVSILRSVRVLLFACAAMSVQWTGSAAGPAVADDRPLRLEPAGLRVQVVAVNEHVAVFPCGHDA